MTTPSRLLPVPARWPLAVLLVALQAACGGGGGGSSPSPDPSTASRSLRPAAEGDVVAAVRSQWQASVSGGMQEDGVAMPVSTTSPAPASESSSSGAAAGDSAVAGAPPQVAGVEEDDLIQSDGRRGVSLAPQGTASDGSPTLNAWLRDGNQVWQGVQKLGLGEGSGAASSRQWTGLHADWTAGRVALLGQAWSNVTPPCPPNAACIAMAQVAPRTELRLYDIDAQAQLKESHRVQWDGDLIASRRVGDMLYLVSVHQPTWSLYGTTAATRETALAALSPQDVLPQQVVDGQPARPQMAETDCWTQPANGATSAQITTLTAVDLSATGYAARSRCFVGGTEAVYLTAQHLYLATSRWPAPVTVAGGGVAYASSAGGLQTDIHKFALDGGALNYRASGSVDGHLGWDRAKNSYRLDADGDDLRVLTYAADVGWAVLADATRTSAPAPSPARLSILHDTGVAGQDLTLRATLPNDRRPEPLGHAGEQLYGVRFAGDRAYAVTFRRTDPLYVLDLSNPDDPRTAGSVELSGYSSDLFPLPQGLLLGVGPSADAQGRLNGLKMVLFDVSRPDQPTVLDTRRYGGAGSTSALDLGRHGLSLQTRDNEVRVALPMSLWIDGVWSAQGLQSLSVDLAGRRLVDHAGWPSAVSRPDQVYSAWGSVGLERGLFVDDQILYLTGGEVQARAW